MKITRHSNHFYHFYDKKHLKEFNIHFDLPATSVAVISAMARALSDQLHTLPDLKKQHVYFKINEQVYEIKQEFHRLQKVAASWTRAVKHIKNASRLDLVIEHVRNPLAPFGSILLNLGKTPVSTDLAKTMPVKLADTLSSFEDKLSQPAFADPFTALAAEAYQHMITDFKTKDKEPTKEPEFFIARLKDTAFLTLVPSKEKNRVNFEDPSTTLKSYYDYILAEYGSQKVKYIETAYALNFEALLDAGAPLTPEIVFKVNMGAGNVEIQDLEKTFIQLPSLLAEAQNADSTQSLLEFLSHYTSSPMWTHRELRGIYAQIVRKQPQPTVQDLINWVQEMTPFDRPVEKLSRPAFDQLLSIYQLTADERDMQFTGRQTVKPFMGDYLLGDTVKFKPWLDQQQLLQAQQEFASKPTAPHFYEKLSFVWCKCHLARVHPAEVFRVGALVPGPADSQGKIQYYNVTEMLNNGRGILVYTLEPACQSTHLPAIKLYRSTCSSAYHLDAQSTLLNDINPINSPGYEGRKYLEPYEKQFYNDRTIPVWVGYHMAAEKRLAAPVEEQEKIPVEALKGIQDLLFKANEELAEDVRKEIPQLKLHEIIRREDSAFLKLVAEMHQDSSLNPIARQRFFQAIQRSSHPIEEILRKLESKKGSQTLQKKRIHAYAQQKKDTELIYNTLLKYHSSEAQRLAQMIDEHVLHPNKVKEKQTKNFNDQTFLKDLDAFHSTCAQMKTDTPQERKQLFTELKRWNAHLKAIAEAKKESLEFKKQQSIAFVGHSLGGACAQVFLTDYTSGKRRIPIPGQHCEMHVFDDPAINEEDSVKFIQFGNSHRRLLRDLDISFHLTRRQEVGDIVPMGGEVHLGAIFNFEDAMMALEWLHCDFAVQEGTKQASVSTIRDSIAAHSTQFELGHPEDSAQIDLLKNIDRSKLSPEEAQKIGMARRLSQGDYIRYDYDSRLQGTFDKTTEPWQWKAINQIWQLPLISPIKAENWRRFAGRTLHSWAGSEFARNPERDPLHGQWTQYTDENGVLAVSTRGVISKQIA